MKNRLILPLMGLSGLGLIALLLALTAWPMPAQAAEPPISLTIDADPAAIQADEEVQFKATLQNTSNNNLQNILLTLTLTGPADRMQPAIIQAESNGVRTDRVRREGNVVRWKGDLQAGGQLVLGLRVASASIASTAVAPGGGQGVDATRLAFIQGLLEQQPKLGALIVLLILLNDYGDAPDSSNHFGVNMTAYAPNITARFPTVFDPATGAPPGPKHKNGLPLHLGPLVSGEWNADRFARRNLDPSADLADLDIRDDGVDPLTLSFQHCVPTTINFQASVSQKAVDEFAANGTTAYLNIWLDGNHDGDWEDVLDCDGIQAPEHIVIDQPVAPAVAGTINLVAPTGSIPVPLGSEDEPMWLRVTISDEPAEKPFQVTSLGRVIDYGDGRGPANGFRWGETEDYLYVPPAAAQANGGRGPNLTIGGEAILPSPCYSASISTRWIPLRSRVTRTRW